MQNIGALLTSLKRNLKKQKKAPQKDFVIRDLKKRTNSKIAKKNLQTLAEIKATLTQWKRENDEIFSQVEAGSYRHDTSANYNYTHKGMKGSTDYIERSYSVENLLTEPFYLDGDVDSEEERNIIDKRNTYYDLYENANIPPNTINQTDFIVEADIYNTNDSKLNEFSYLRPCAGALNEVYRGDKEGPKKKTLGQHVNSFEDLKKKLSNHQRYQNSDYC
ncbi:hypothetical protein LOD99_6463 [Oopsacas minuta]|uniref:Uncharacterized protein n=1 Tax=Oopsacas minuta TaxID=111878 RepID=A0AAV7JN76_9METZ|nr:hypothetical protein LOD99_6463 [Oopsacas minuta]